MADGQQGFTKEASLDDLKKHRDRSLSRDHQGVFIVDTLVATIPFRLEHQAGDSPVSRITSIEDSRFDVMLTTKTRAFHAKDTDTVIPPVQYDALLWSSFDFPLMSEQFYLIKAAGQTRISDREALIYEILPRVPDRFGLQLLVDEETGLLLGKTVMDDTYGSLESYRFVTLSPEKVVREPVSDWQILEQFAINKNKGKASSTPAMYAISDMPSGFVPVSVSEMPGDTVYHYSDGFFDLSVFVETVKSGTDCKEKEYMHGGFAVYCRSGKLQGEAVQQQITVTGHLPMDTLKKISQSVHKKTP